MKDKDKICKNEMERAWENRKKELVDKYRKDYESDKGDYTFEEWLCCYLNMVEDEYEVIEKEFTKLNTEMHRKGKTYQKTEYRKRFEDEWA
tara:strand:- start:453 stop:725 length:273 start_codon:yes stop_codon:yes gene_type:complete